MSDVDRLATSTEEERDAAVTAAAGAVRRGELVVIPTDTVYGIAADAFSHDAVRRLLEAKGRGREMPPPVLVSAATTLDALAEGVPTWARTLVERFWPGPLTLVCRQQASLMWDLGETRGTVAVRMPDDAVALAVLERTGPLAVSSANLTGRPAATDADVHAVELDEGALAWAERNLAGTGVDLRHGDLATAFDDLAGTVDVVVCNPPYIPLEAWESVAAEARDHDPHLALFSGQDGLDAIRVLEQRAALLLRPGGVVGAEHADVQGESAPGVFAASGRWLDVADHRDLAGRARYLTARLAR